jgi:hypothetical protein
MEKTQEMKGFTGVGLGPLCNNTQVRGVLTPVELKFELKLQSRQSKVS